MSTKITKIVATTAMALSLGIVAAPAVSASTPPSADPVSTPATPIVGSVGFCVMFGSVAFCL
ncbi:hypothetical protein [Nocardia sp. 2TAF39]|uniref:hypothetical protein n=1 Tax=Nocardia sp. 2TAF39 TaxID=3233017 RepID=UPI003F9442F3